MGSKTPGKTNFSPLLTDDEGPIFVIRLFGRVVGQEPRADTVTFDRHMDGRERIESQRLEVLGAGVPWHLYTKGGDGRGVFVTVRGG